MEIRGPGGRVAADCGIKILVRSPDNTVELMAQALERLYQEGEFRAKMGQAGRARAEQVYRWDHLGERLLKIYEEVLGAPSPEA